MAKSDLIVVWGGNPVSTQVNVMTHITRARKERGAKLVVVDPYRSPTAAVADLHLAPRPGTDGALACAVMHVAFRDGYADRAYMARYADCPDALEAHLRSRGPEWAAAITGLPVQQIEAFARAVRPHPAQLHPLRLRFRAQPQRRRRTCTRSPACRPSPAPGSTKAAARCGRTAACTTSTRR